MPSTRFYVDISHQVIKATSMNVMIARVCLLKLETRVYYLLPCIYDQIHVLYLRYKQLIS